LERTQVTEDDASVLLADDPRVLETAEDGVHLAQAAGREVGERVLGDAEREHVPARVLHPEAARGLDERGGDPRAQIEREKAGEAEYEADPALGHERYHLADGAGMRAHEGLEELRRRDPADAHVGVGGGLEDAREAPVDERRVTEDLAGREKVQQDAAAVRPGNRESDDT